MPPKAPSPMMRHFLQVKQEHPDSLIFYRCGDFYETFYEDARTAAQELDITLTSRDKNSEAPVPMAGVPYHAADQYIARLIDKGFKVAVVEQMEDPKLAKGMVKREVSRIVTPGLVVDDDNLEADRNNYIVSVKPGNDTIGLAVLDISTAEFRVTEVFEMRALANELVKLGAREIVLPDSARNTAQLEDLLPWGEQPLVNYRNDIDFDTAHAADNLARQFKTESLAGFGCDGLDNAISAAGALLAYVQETQMQAAAHIQSIHPYAIHDFMVLDETTKTNLELERTIIEGKKRGSLIGLLDQCKTPGGSRKLRQWLNYPLLNTQRIRERHALVEDLYLQATRRETVRELLASVGDMSRLVARITMDRANARHLAGLAEALSSIADLKAFLQNLSTDLYDALITGIEPLPELADELGQAIADEPPLTVREGKMFKKGYNPELDELIDLADHGKDQILNMEATERDKRGFPLRIRYNRVFGYYIEVSKTHVGKVPESYIRKQTLTNAERYITPELKEFEEKVLNAQEKRNDLEYRLFEELRSLVMDHTLSLQKTAETVSKLDVLASFAHTAATRNYIKPDMTEGDDIHLVDARHPVIEALQTDEPFIPNDTTLDCGENELLIITGPNMAGKSTVMRQVALVVLMAQMGSFVPARKAEIGVVDRIFTRVGAADNLVRGLSTFMVEMTETANILHNASKKSLIILDEIGRGTSTFDGLSIAWAVAEFIHDRIGAKTMFATHYHELTELVRTKKGVRNLNIAVKEWEDHIIFLRKLVEGPANRSYGIQVGRLAGLPNPVIHRAKEVLTNLEHGELDTNGMPSFARSRKNGDSNQMALFAVKTIEREHPILDELDRLVPDALSPIEALNTLFKWKRLREKAKKSDK